MKLNKNLLKQYRMPLTEEQKEENWNLWEKCGRRLELCNFCKDCSNCSDFEVIHKIIKDPFYED